MPCSFVRGGIHGLFAGAVRGADARLLFGELDSCYI